MIYSETKEENKLQKKKVNKQLKGVLDLSTGLIELLILKIKS